MPTSARKRKNCVPLHFVSSAAAAQAQRRYYISCPLHGTYKRVGRTSTTCTARGALRIPKPWFWRRFLHTFCRCWQKVCRRRHPADSTARPTKIHIKFKRGRDGCPAPLRRLRYLFYSALSTPVASLNSLIRSSSSFACAWTASHVPFVSYQRALRSCTSLPCCSTQV